MRIAPLVATAFVMLEILVLLPIGLVDSALGHTAVLAIDVEASSGISAVSMLNVDDCGEFINPDGSVVNVLSLVAVPLLAPVMGTPLWPLAVRVLVAAVPAASELAANMLDKDNSKVAG